MGTSSASLQHDVISLLAALAAKSKRGKEKGGKTRLEITELRNAKAGRDEIHQEKERWRLALAAHIFN